MVKEFWKSVNICQSYGQLSTGLFFYETPCTFHDFPDFSRICTNPARINTGQSGGSGTEVPQWGPGAKAPVGGQGDENFESAAHAVCRHTTNYTHSLFNKNINLCAVCSWDICLQLHFMCSCTAVARAHPQLPHDNGHWTCKRLPPYPVPDSIRIRIVATYSIRHSIRTEISDSQVPSMHDCTWFAADKLFIKRRYYVMVCHHLCFLSCTLKVCIK